MLLEARIRGCSASDRLKAVTIQCLNKKMRNFNQRTSKATSLVVYKIMIAEILVGNFSEGRIHRDGLARIVELRGGLNKV